MHAPHAPHTPHAAHAHAHAPHAVSAAVARPIARAIASAVHPTAVTAVSVRVYVRRNRSRFAGSESGGVFLLVVERGHKMEKCPRSRHEYFH